MPAQPRGKGGDQVTVTRKDRAVLKRGIDGVIVVKQKLEELGCVVEEGDGKCDLLVTFPNTKHAYLEVKTSRKSGGSEDRVTYAGIIQAQMDQTMMGIPAYVVAAGTDWNRDLEPYRVGKWFTDRGLIGGLYHINELEGLVGNNS